LFVACVAALGLLVPAARSDSIVVSWTPPTPADQSRIAVTAGSPVSFTLTASAAVTDVVVHIDAVGAPPDAVFNTSDGGAARATFEWMPHAPGEYTIQFTASTDAGASAPSRTVVIHVSPPVHYPRSYTLSSAAVARWATVWKRSPVRSRPSAAAPVVTTLETRTTDGTQNIVLVLDGVDVSATETWYRVRLAILPNNSTGWVPADDLGRLFAVHTHLYVDRARMTATLKRDGVTVFRALVGVGRPASPTPRGEFYIRDKLTRFDEPFYGPVAFGTNARSAVLTDWPDGGFVGVHGTDRPDLLPGRVSHGCIHMRNEELLKLARLMPVGTPVTIR
jgi:lipoprotein-anchoring transpeptidase ErfK/SrfK